MADARPAAFYTNDRTNYFTGYLVKQGGRIKTWKRRFFVLEKRNRILRYYKNPDETLPKGVIHVVGYSVGLADSEIKKQFAFKIEKIGFRTYYMIADDEGSRNEWLSVLNECAAEDATGATQVFNSPYANFDNDTDLSDDESKSSPTKSKSSDVDNTLVKPKMHINNDATIAAGKPGVTRLLPNMNISGGEYRDPNATLISDYVRPDPNATLIGADMLAYRAVDDMATLVPSTLDNNATLVADGSGGSGAFAGFVNNSGKLKSAMPTIVPHVRLLPHNSLFNPVDRDVLRTVKFGRLKADDNNDADFIGYDSKVVSRRHAEIWAVNNEFYIRDTKSQSGTFLNAMRLSLPGDESKPFKLKTGDIIQFGVDYRGGSDDNTKCVAMTVELSFRKFDGTSETVPAMAGPPQLTDLTLIAPNNQSR